VPDIDPAAVLAEIGARNEASIEFHRYTPWTVEHDVPEGDVRRLVKTVEAVLAEHHEALTEPGFCAGCGFTLPCATMRAITRELTGKGNGGD
jgi:hypothetical protein